MEMVEQIKIRNIGILAHVDAGKTTITEHMLYISGRIRNIGSVDKGTAHTDWMEIERERGISVRSASTVFHWKNVDVNLIDTPGHVDFSAEVERSLRVLDGAILVISAVEGIQAHTEILWNGLQALHIPTLIFINKIDRAGSNAASVLDDIHRLLSPSAVPIQVIENECTDHPIIKNIWKEIPAHEKAVEKAFDDIMECLAEKNDSILEKYINGDPLPSKMLREEILSYTRNGQAFPVLYGSAINGLGVTELMDGIVEYLPPPSGDVDGPVSGIIFKIDHDKSMGRVAHIRLYNGTIRNRDAVFNVNKNIEEKVTQIRKVYAQKHEDIGFLSAGDIASVCGFSEGAIGDILGNPTGIPKGYQLATPLLTVQAFPQNDQEYPALVAALQELADEDPLLGLQWLKNERELHVNIMGVVQLEVLSSLIESRFNLQVRFGSPSVIYKETPSSVGEGYVAYTMPKPCWAILRFHIEPGERGSGVVYSANVRTEDILLRYQNQVEKTIPEALKQGLYGWEVTDLRITLVEGQHHVFHTHPLDFIVATPMGIMDGLTNTGTTLLEPILQFRISVPEEIGGRILGDLIQMRGTFDSPVISSGMFIVEGELPVATSLDYPIKLASISSGKGVVSTRFSGYQECPLELGARAPRRGIDPRDRAKYILSVRNALSSDVF